MSGVREPERSIPVKGEYDVVVCGGGPAGLAAAVAAARGGARTVLVERSGCLGGLATGGLVLYMDGVADGEGRRRVGGIPWEIMERLREWGCTAEDGELRIHLDSEALKVLADRMCLEAGVELRLHSLVVDAVLEGERVLGVVTESKEGRGALLGTVCVDATGDGDLAARAGVPFDEGRQRIGLNLKAGGIDLERYRAFLASTEWEGARRDLRALGHLALHPARTPWSGQGVYWINILGLAGRSGGPDVPSDEDGATVHDAFRGHLSGLDVGDLSHAEVELRRLIWDSMAWYRARVPGFEKAHILAFASQLGVRESRRIRCRTILSRVDVERARDWSDTCGTAALHFGDRRAYRVPWGSLVPASRRGVVVAGRCMGTDEWVQQTTRLIPAAMVTGQAAGAGAALCAARGIDPAALESAELRRVLERDQVIL